MKSVLISIQPKWVNKIASGEKTIEVRKTRPKLETPFKCYIYCTNSGGTLHTSYDGLHYHKSYVGKSDLSCINGKVIGEFVCDKMLESFLNNNDGWFIEKGCLTQEEIDKYQGDNPILYGWHISDLKIYDKPKELFDFANYNKYQVCKERNCFSDNCWICPNNAIVIRPPQSYFFVEFLGG